MILTFDQIAAKKAVLFDLDGTLVHSMWMWKAIDIDFLARFGYECPEDLQPNIEGMSFHETACYFKEHFHIPMDIEEMKSCWNEMAYDKYKNEVPFKKGALRFLQELKRQGIKIGIATSNSMELVEAVTTSLQMTSYIDVIVTGSEVHNGKPAPDIYLECAKRLNVPAGECVVFEDITAGIEAAKRAGMLVCAVDDEYSIDQAQKKRELADAWIDDFDCLF